MNPAPPCPPSPLAIRTVSFTDTAATNGKDAGGKRGLEDSDPSFQQKAFAAGLPGVRLLSSAVMQSVQPPARASASDVSVGGGGKRRKSADGGGGVVPT